MTEIKRSIYILVFSMALIIFLPMLRSADNISVNIPGIDLSQSLMSSPLLGIGVKADSNISSDVVSIHRLSENDLCLSLPSLEADTPIEALSQVPYSMLYNIAVTDTLLPVEISEKEREMIAATVQLEVLGKYSRADQFERPDLKYYEMLAVAQIVRNRLESEIFPNDIKTVICDSRYTKNGLVYQFSTSPYLRTTSPTELAYAAVDEVFGDGISVLPDDYYYFCATWRENRFEINNRPVLRFLGSVGEYDKIVADATTFYAGVTMQENINAGYVF
ncbi:MAG: cell wall hydrolase [Clostridia bacterium]|nr:cell wall hydrolase [Clostridia bacterium]